MKIEIRSANEVRISGYVNAVERDSRVLPKSMSRKATSDFVEKVSAGAFGRAISRSRNIRLLFNHVPERELGSTAGGQLSLTEDNIGLYAKAVITDAEVVKAAKNGELRGWSFGFENDVDNWEPYRENIQRRTLFDFDLPEVSILTKTPAYYGTSVETRSDGTENLIEVRSFDDNVHDITDNSETRAEELTENKPNTADFYEKQLEIIKIKGEINVC